MDYKKASREAGQLPSEESIDHPPFPSEVFSQNSNHPLHGSQDSSVDDHWSVLVIAVMPAKYLEGENGKYDFKLYQYWGLFFQNLNKNTKECWPNKGEVEADRQLEIQLNGGTLMVPANGILDLNVDLCWEVRAMKRLMFGGSNSITAVSHDSPLVHKTLHRLGWEPISPQSRSSCSQVAVKTNTNSNSL